MPYKAKYTQKTVGKSSSGGSVGAIGGPSKPVSIKPMFNKNKATSKTNFPG